MEYVDIYDKDRRPTGRIRPKGEPLAEGEYILIAHLVLFDGRGNMLIQRRKEDKADWPGYWDITSGGGAMAGEASWEAAQREAWEELGITVALAEERPVLTIHYPLGFDDYYILRRELDAETLRLQPEEVLDARWASRGEILEMIRRGEFVGYKDGFIELLFALLEGRGSYGA